MTRETLPIRLVCLAALLVPRGALEALRTARPSRWESEEERQALMGRLCCCGASASGGRPSWRNAGSAQNLCSSLRILRG